MQQGRERGGVMVVISKRVLSASSRSKSLTNAQACCHGPSLFIPLINPLQDKKRIKTAYNQCKRNNQIYLVYVGRLFIRTSSLQIVLHTTIFKILNKRECLFYTKNCYILIGILYLRYLFQKIKLHLRRRKYEHL